MATGAARLTAEPFVEIHLNEIALPAGLDRNWLAGCAQVLETTIDYLTDAGMDDVAPYVFIALPGGDGLTLGYKEWEIQSAFDLSFEGASSERPPSLYLVPTAQGDPSAWTDQRYQQRIPCPDHLCAVYESTNDETGASRGAWINLASSR